MKRRSFLKCASASLAGAVFPGAPALRQTLQPGPAVARKFTMSLNPGMVGVNVSLDELINYALDFGFEAIAPPTETVARLSDARREAVANRMQDRGLQWGSAGLPVDFRKDAGTFNTGMQSLPAIAAGLQKAGVTRMNTWIMPRHDTLTYMENFRQHATRLKAIGSVLNDHGIRFGLEYVGPLTLRSHARYTFIHSMKETRELLDAIGLPNMGFVLDSFHWYTAHETAEDILAISNDDVVACDLNDVPVGRAIDEQIDGQRMLPLSTGMIDIKSFLEALVAIGYDGPVRAEPFNQELNALPNEAAVSYTSTAMHAALGLL